MNLVDKNYFGLVNKILTKGKIKHNRTGINTISLFGEQLKFDINLNEFPILTTKKVWFKGVVHELIWFIQGDTNIKYLVDNDVHIWDEWAYTKYKNHMCSCHSDILTQEQFINNIKSLSKDDKFVLSFGELGKGTYGGMWRAFPYYNDVIFDDVEGPNYRPEECYVDQLKNIIDKLKTNPDDRRMIVSAWHPYWVNNCALPPCHCFYHFNTEELTEKERVEMWSKQQDEKYGPQMYRAVIPSQLPNDIPTRKLNCLMYIRSNDIFLGAPFNISSYSLLTAMVAQCVNMVPGELTYTIGDAHIYSNHVEQIKLQLSREPMELPKLWLNPDIKNLFDFKYDDIKLINYNSHPTIKAEVAI